MIEAIVKHQLWLVRVLSVVIAHPLLLDVLFGKEEVADGPLYPMPGPLA